MQSKEIIYLIIDKKNLIQLTFTRKNLICNHKNINKFHDYKCNKTKIILTKLIISIIL